MPKVEELELGATAQVLLALLPEWVNQKSSSSRGPIAIEAFESLNRKVYAKFDLLASVDPEDFRALLSADDLIPKIEHEDYYTKLFFAEYLNSSQERKNNFLNNCTGDELSVYVRRNCWYFRNENDYWHKNKGHDIFFAEFKQTLSNLCALINQHKELAPKDADILRVLIIERFVNTYGYLNPNNGVEVEPAIKRQERDYCANQIAEVLKSINDVNTPCEYRRTLLGVILELNDAANQHPKLVKDLVYSLINRGIKITYNSDRASDNVTLDDSLICKKICDNDNATHDFVRHAISKNQDIPKTVIIAALENAIKEGNKGAISGLFNCMFAGEQIAWDKLEFSKLLFKQTASYTLIKTVRGVLYYLSLNDMSVSNMLTYVNEKHGAKTLKEVINNLFAIEQKYPENIQMYLGYEESEAKNVFYYFAQHPEICAEQNIGFYKAHATNKMIIKSNPNLCPLTLAIHTQNVPFLIFAIDVIGSKANKQLISKITDGILKLIEQGVDPKNIVSHLEGSILKYNRPFRWLSFEYNLLHAINAKVVAMKATSTNTGSTGLFWRFSSAASRQVTTLVAAAVPGAKRRTSNRM